MSRSEVRPGIVFRLLRSLVVLPKPIAFLELGTILAVPSRAALLASGCGTTQEGIPLSSLSRLGEEAVLAGLTLPAVKGSIQIAGGCFGGVPRIVLEFQTVDGSPSSALCHG